MRREDYNDLKNVTLGSWAWEFARRWPDYVNAHAAHRQGALTRMTQPDGMEILSLSRPEPDAARFGLFCFVSPRHSCLDAPIFWTEDANHRVTTVEVRARHFCQDAQKGDGCFNLSGLSCRRFLLVDHDGTQHLRLISQRRTIQLRCEGDSLLSGVVQMRCLLRFSDRFDAKIETLRRFKQVYDNLLPEQPSGPKWTRAALSLRDHLIVLDVHLGGGSHRDAAMILYGEKEGHARYHAADQSVRNRMRRLRRKALCLMRGGYLALMKPNVA